MNSNHNSRLSPDLPELAAQINRLLGQVADKDWNYSRIRLELRSLAEMESPYVLWAERLDVNSKAGKAELTQIRSEVTWGSRHSDELGFLEIVSLRLNKALLDLAPAEGWVIRTVKKQELEAQGVVDAFWYRIEEVGGEDFENR